MCNPVDSPQPMLYGRHRLETTSSSSFLTAKYCWNPPCYLFPTSSSKVASAGKLTLQSVLHPAGDHDTTGGIDDDTVVVEDENEAEDDSDAVMVDALEALRLAQPHMAHASNAVHHSDENLRPQTATGSRQSSNESSLTNGGHSMQGKGQSPLKGSSNARRRGSNRMAPLADGSMWGLFGKGTTDDVRCNGKEETGVGEISVSVQSGLQSRLAEAAEDMHAVHDEGRNDVEETAFDSSQYWKTPIMMPDDIENA